MPARSAGTRWRAAFAPVAVLLALLLLGCGGSGHRGARTRATAGPPPQPSVRCGSPSERARTLRFRASDGASLDGAIVGGGPVGVVLLHEYPGPMCGWWPYAAYLSHHGMQALLFDFRCLGLSSCPRGREANPGEREVSGLVPGADISSVKAAARVTAPALFAVARDDRYVSVADMRAVYRRAASPIKRLMVLPPVAGHGWDMLTGSGLNWSPLAREILAFITSHVHPVASPTLSRDGCASTAAGARGATLHPRGGAPLPGVLLGTGATTFVLSNESDENLCSWLPFVRTLERHGNSALLYDAGDPAAIPAEATAGAMAARAAGARRVVLMGASVGARGSLVAAARRIPGITAVVSLSAERTIRSDPGDLTHRIHRVRIPALLISARADPFVGGATTALARALASRRREVLIVPGIDHGTSLLTGADGRRVQAAIFAFTGRPAGGPSRSHR
jgi:pimeloyl-ACP methyl ester carboxylesterase